MHFFRHPYANEFEEIQTRLQIDESHCSKNISLSGILSTSILYTALHVLCFSLSLLAIVLTTIYMSLLNAHVFGMNVQPKMRYKLSYTYITQKYTLLK